MSWHDFWPPPEWVNRLCMWLIGFLSGWRLSQNYYRKKAIERAERAYAAHKAGTSK